MTEKKYTITEHGNFLCIAENDKQITGYFESYQKEDLLTIVDLLNGQDARIKELEETIDTIAKDYEVSHGMDIRNAEWFTAW